MEYVYYKAKAQAASLILRALVGMGFPAVTAESVKVDTSKFQDFDLASAIPFMLAKQSGKTPQKVAEEICEGVKSQLAAPKGDDGDTGYIGGCAAQNGFVNFTLSPRYFSDCAGQAVSFGKNYGSSNEFAGKLAIVEYSSPNVGKPMHIGHIRSTILGDSVANLLGQVGYDLVRMNYLCEAGAQVAGILLAIEILGMEKLNDEKDLLKYYVEITKRIEADPALKAREQQIIAQMEAYDPRIMPLLKRVRELTLTPFDKNYHRLGIRFDDPVFDSDYVPLAKKLVAEAQDLGIAAQDKKGEIVGLLEGKSNLPNLIILRSNGTTLYSTRDMGFAQWRWDKYRFDKSVIVTASEQNTHFKQVFKLLELMGREWSDRLYHIGFGLVFLEGGVKLSSRKGNVLLLEDVLDDAVGFARPQIRAEHGYTPAEVDSIAQAVGVGAVKFAILRVSAEKNINFSMEKAVSFEGDTGAYLQYTVVRAKNILHKAKDQKIDFQDAKAGPDGLSDPEKDLLRLIAQYPEIIRSSAVSMAPHSVCDFALKVAGSFSTFYSACPVLEAPSLEQKRLRLAMVQATANTLSSALGILGIAVPEKM